MEFVKVLNIEMDRIKSEDLKKIKVEPEKFAKIKAKAKYAKEEENAVEPVVAIAEEVKPVIEEKVVEEPVQSVEFPKAEVPVFEPEEKAIEEKSEEPVQEDIEDTTAEIEADLENKLNSIESFPFHVDNQEDEISQEQIDNIKAKGNEYKGKSNIDLSKLIDSEPKKQEHKATAEDLESEFRKESFSKKAQSHKEKIEEEYNGINAAISENTENLTQNKHLIKSSEDEKKEWTQVLVGYLEEMQNTNELKLKYMENSSSPRAEAILREFSLYFDEIHEKAELLQKEIKEKDNEIKALKEKENQFIELSTNLKEKLEAFIKEKYEELVEINKIDEELRSAEEKMTEKTGYSENDTVKTETVEEVTYELPKTEPDIERKKPTSVINIGNYSETNMFEHDYSDVLDENRQRAA